MNGQRWLVIYVRNGRIGSVELTDSNLAAFHREFCMSLIQRDVDGTEHWQALAPWKRAR